MESLEVSDANVQGRGAAPGRAEGQLREGGLAPALELGSRGGTPRISHMADRTGLFKSWPCAVVSKPWKEMSIISEKMFKFA